jgi:hypothetical protein
MEYQILLHGSDTEAIVSTYGGEQQWDFMKLHLNHRTLRSMRRAISAGRAGIKSALMRKCKFTAALTDDS